MFSKRSYWIFLVLHIDNLSLRVRAERHISSAYIKTTHLISSSSLLLQNESSSGGPSVNTHLVKLQECEEECDEKIREAKFAFRFQRFRQLGCFFLLFLPQVKKTLTRILRTSSIGPLSFTFPEARKRIFLKLARVKMAFFKPAVQRVSTMKSSRKPSISARSRLVPVNCWRKPNKFQQPSNPHATTFLKRTVKRGWDNFYIWFLQICCKHYIRKFPRLKHI